MGENKKGFLCCGWHAGQAEQDGVGWELSTRSHPIPSHPIASCLIPFHPTRPTGPLAGPGMTLGCGVWGSLQEQGQLRDSTGPGLGGLVGPHCADGTLEGAGDPWLVPLPSQQSP